MKVEIGSPICCKGKICKLGKASKGTPTRVEVELKCPPGFKPVGIFHTHPGGRAFPSRTDIENLRKAKLPVSCIATERETRCFLIKLDRK